MGDDLALVGDAVTAEPVAHEVARCCWCHGALWRVGAHYWCRTAACADGQRAWGMGATTAEGWRWVYVPLPVQVEVERQRRPGMSDGTSFNVLAGGAAGTTKSTSARWSMYRRAMTLAGYEGLLLRRTFPELENTHLRRMAADERVLKALGVRVEFRPTARQMVFHETGALIQCGHMADPSDLDKYLSTEYDDVVPDEASTFLPGPLMQVASRARSSKASVIEAGGPWFRPLTNPGGASARVLADLFIHHQPDFELMSEARAHYDPRMWVAVLSTLEDNPYLGAGYGAQLALTHLDDPVRFRQLRYGDWDVMVGQFFSTWRETKAGAPWHVRELDRSVVKTAEWARSMDWGRTQFGCMGWWLLLADGHLHRVSEYKFQDKDVAEVAAAVRQRDKDLGLDPEQYRYSICDRALFAKTQDKLGEPIAEQFAAIDRAFLRFRPSVSDRQNGWERLRSFLRDDGTGTGPWLTVDPSCRYFRRTIPLMQSDPHNPEDLDTSSDDHAMDEARYFCMSRPSPFDRGASPVYPEGSIGAEVESLRAAASESV